MILSSIEKRRWGGRNKRRKLFLEGDLRLQKMIVPRRLRSSPPRRRTRPILDLLCEFSKIGLDNIAQYEKELLEYTTKKISSIKGVKLIGTAKQKSSVVSFVIDNIHPHDIGTVLDREGIAIRTGHHCTMPLMKRFNVPATSRISLSFYNTKNEIDKAVKAVEKAIEILG